jgi:hypothetical protein
LDFSITEYSIKIGEFYGEPAIGRERTFPEDDWLEIGCSEKLACESRR